MYEKETIIHDKTNEIMDGVIKLTGNINSYLTGKPPFKYFRGNRYIMVIYYYGSNDILTESAKNCEGESITNAFEKLYNSLSNKGLKPLFQKLDNQASNILIQIIQDKNIDFQLFPPNMHRSNAAERAIQTFKNHFIK